MTVSPPTHPDAGFLPHEQQSIEPPRFPEIVISLALRPPAGIGLPEAAQKDIGHGTKRPSVR